jgi:predicted Zn-ribbon and HTH transcriptional regulator
MTCHQCQGETADGVNLCATDAERFLTDLRGIPDLIEELTSIMSVLKAPARGGISGGGLPGSKAPGDFEALNSKLTLENLLHGMYWHAGNEIVIGLDPFDYVAQIVGNLGAVIGHKSILSYVAQLRDEVKRAERVLEGASYRVILGPCETIGCGTTLFATEGDHEARCPTCTHEYAIKPFLERRAMEALDHDGTPLRASQAVRYLNQQGVKVTTQDVKNWVHRGMQHTSTDPQGHKLYDLLTIYKKAKTA